MGGSEDAVAAGSGGADGPDEQRTQRRNVARELFAAAGAQLTLDEAENAINTLAKLSETSGGSVLVAFATGKAVMLNRPLGEVEILDVDADLM